MFEDKTYEDILDDMLENVPSNVDTREGSIIYDALAPIALEVAQVYSDLSVIMDECFADTAGYYYLIKRAAERGIIVKEGVPAELKITVTPADIEIELGTEFNVGELNYTVTGTAEDGNYLITCKESGTAGNNIMDECIPVEYVEGLETVEIVSINTWGTDDESVDELRERYFNSFREVAFGGNKADYKEKAESLERVACCKVTPAWNGPRTVKLTVTDKYNDYKGMSASNLAVVQNYFDPTQDGTGVGIAPIGHIVTVDTVSEDNVSIAADVKLESGMSFDDVADPFYQAIENYFLELRKTWGEEDIVIRPSRIETICLNITGFTDITDVKINGNSGNYICDSNKVPCFSSDNVEFTVV